MGLGWTGRDNGATGRYTGKRWDGLGWTGVYWVRLGYTGMGGLRMNREKWDKLGCTGMNWEFWDPGGLQSGVWG